MIPQGRQNPQHPGFVAPDAAHDCAKCVRWHGEKYRFPALTAYDAEAWALMHLLRGQQRMGLEPIGLDYAVLPTVFALEGIPPERHARLFHQLVRLDHAFQAHYAAEREKERNKKPPPQNGPGAPRG